MKSGQALPVSILRAAPQGNPQPLKIPTIRSSWLARSFLWLPHNPRFVVFICHTFCKRQKRRLHSNRHHRAALAPEKKQLKAIIHNLVMVVSLPKGRAIGKPITKLCIIAAQNQRFSPASLPEDQQIPLLPFSGCSKKNMSGFISMCLR